MILKMGKLCEWLDLKGTETDPQDLLIIKSLEWCCPVELSMMMEMFHISTIQYDSHTWLLST